jgi:SAM-dependent methyltransferase
MKPDEFTCVLCGLGKSRPWLTNCPDYYLQKGGPVDYVKCSGCSLVQQYPLPADVSALYADYPIHTSRNTIQRLARRIFQRQVYYRPESPGLEQQTLLDYGCGDGTFLREMQERFGTVLGFEPGGTHAGVLSGQLGASVYSSVEKLCEERAGTVDIITAHFVLEHIADLCGTFETLRTLLKPGGILHIAVPNIRSWEARLFKQRWHGLDAPRHLVFPDAGHFEILSAEYGFTVPKVSFAAFPNTLAASLATVFSGRCHSGMLMGLILPSWLVSLAAPQGTLVIQMFRKD